VKATPSAVLAACLVLGMRVAEAPGDTLYTRPGQLMAADDGTRLNVYCEGSGSPTVIFDSGWGDWAPAWAVVQPRVAKYTRACSYDRGGSGFSTPGPMPRTSVRLAEELHSALKAGGIAGPYILVGNAFGGDPARTFADLYTAETAGLVMVEADASDVEPPAMREDDHRGDPNFLAQMRACRDSIAAGKPLPLWPRHHTTASCAEQAFFRGLPESQWSPELNATLLHMARTNAAMYDAFISEMEQTPWDETWLQQHRQSLGNRPVRVLTTGNHGVGHLPAPNAQDPKHQEYEHQVALAQARWLELSSNARQIFTPESSEYVEFDQPDTVVAIIHEVYVQSPRLDGDEVKGAPRPGSHGLDAEFRSYCARTATRLSTMTSVVDTPCFTPVPWSLMYPLSVEPFLTRLTVKPEFVMLVPPDSIA
jgi:pimeloyl-ACP methyl ester carboxylesterase